MRRGGRAFAMLAAAALALAFAAPASATRAQPVPFGMHTVGADGPLDMSPGFPFARDLFGGRCTVAADWVLSVSSTGTAAHLGRVAVEQDHCTRIDIFTVPNPGTVSDGRMTITAADGDELWLDYTATFVFVPGATPDVGVSKITSWLTIVGGTGRFEGATGSLVGHAIDDFPAGPHTADFSGTIVYDPSVQANS